MNTKKIEKRNGRLLETKLKIKKIHTRRERERERGRERETKQKPVLIRI